MLNFIEIIELNFNQIKSYNQLIQTNIKFTFNVLYLIYTTFYACLIFINIKQTSVRIINIINKFNLINKWIVF